MVRGKWATLREVIVDSGFSARFVDRVTTRCGWTVTTTRGLAGRFGVHPRRRVVERTFGWLVRYRRLTVDREYEIGVSEAMIRVARIPTARRLDPPRWSQDIFSETVAERAAGMGIARHCGATSED
jgi:putative transposase